MLQFKSLIICIAGSVVLSFFYANLYAQTAFNGIYRTSVDGVSFTMHNDTSVFFEVESEPVISLNEFESVKSKYDKKLHLHQLMIDLTDEGKIKFAELTRDNIGKPLALIINNKLLTAPTVHEEIKGGELMITGIDKKLIKEILKYFKAEK